jgi:hypothetical protein
MSEQRSKQTENEDVSRVDHLFGLLRDVSRRDPSPALRERLVILTSQRLREERGNAERIRTTGRKRLVWFTPVIAASLVVAAGLATLAVHWRHHGPAQADKIARVGNPPSSPDRGAPIAAETQPLRAKHAKVYRPQQVPARPASPRRVTMQLPYSNSAIRTGTDTTIQVSMSQSELLSLGFPINATAQDRRIVAELTLGDDGLPRAISLPLPLEVMKEKK